MACREINERYASEGYIIKEIKWDKAFEGHGIYFPESIDATANSLYNIFSEINLGSISCQAIIQQYNELYIYNNATESQRNILAPQVKVRYGICHLPEIFYPKFCPIMKEDEVWKLSESDLQIYLGSRLQWFGITFKEYKKFVDATVNLCEDFDLREDDIFLNPSNIGYHPVLGLRIIDYGLTNENNYILDTIS